MLTMFGKKKLTEEKAANIFVNALQALIDEGYQDVTGLINDSPEFVSRPEIGPDGLGAFTLVVLAANIQSLTQHFEAGQDKRITESILEKFAVLYEMDKMELAKMMTETRQFMSRKNHPSKVVGSGMAKALFCKYGLSKHQEAYFRNLGVPNPIFLQRFKEAMEHFLWDWDAFLQKYKVA